MLKISYYNILQFFYINQMIKIIVYIIKIYTKRILLIILRIISISKRKFMYN